jgi:hypothetical protein
VADRALLGVEGGAAGQVGRERGRQRARIGRQHRAGQGLGPGADDGEALVARSKNAVDGATPSGTALVAAALSGIWCFVFSRGDLLILTFALMVLVYIRHWPNLQRIKAGTEPKIGQKS